VEGQRLAAANLEVRGRGDVSGSKETGHGGSVVCGRCPGIVEGTHTLHWAILFDQKAKPKRIDVKCTN
jgi:hypothetical protein